MSREARPISPQSFLLALPALPFTSLRSKLLELQNSVSHLEDSNSYLNEHIVKEGDDEYGELSKAVKENDDVIGRFKQRIEMVELEMQRRRAGGSCEAEMDVDPSELDEDALRRMEEQGRGPGLVRLQGQEQRVTNGDTPSRREGDQRGHEQEDAEPDDAGVYL